MAGLPGFEPGNAGIKIQCLTAWRQPYCEKPSSGYFAVTLQCFDFKGWQGCQDSNLGMLESKSSALPLGDSPVKSKLLSQQI